MKNSWIKNTLIAIAIVIALNLIDFLGFFIFFKTSKSIPKQIDIDKWNLMIQIFEIILIVLFIRFQNKTKKISPPAIKRDVSQQKIQIAIQIMIITILMFGVFVYFHNFSIKIQDYNLTNAVIEISLVAILSPIVQELVFRKVILQIFDKNVNQKLYGILLSSILFAIVHEFYAYKIIGMFIWGIFLALIYYNYGLFYTILSHGLWNFLSIVERSQFSSYLMIHNGNIKHILVVLSILIIIYAYYWQYKILTANPAGA